MGMFRLGVRVRSLQFSSVVIDCQTEETRGCEKKCYWILGLTPEQLPSIFYLLRRMVTPCTAITNRRVSLEKHANRLPFKPSKSYSPKA